MPRQRVGGEPTMAKEILCGFGVDVDAVAGWLGSYGGEDSPDDIALGRFAGEVGSPRLLKLFGRLGLKTTWFIPGHSIETFPAEMKAVAEGGHEIGIHGYSHENPWTKIDYSKQPAEWMVPLWRGRETDLIEIPVAFDLVSA